MTERQVLMGQYISVLLQDPTAKRAKTRGARFLALKNMVTEDFCFVWSQVGLESLKRMASSALSAIGLK